MANWCSNTVVFEGKPETITAIQKLFQLMKKEEEETEEGQLPEFISKDNVKTRAVTCCCFEPLVVRLY